MYSLQTYFTRKQATIICENFCQLIGTPLDVRSGLSEPIERIVIAPVDEPDKWLFIHDLNNAVSVERALAHYGSNLYDVILLARLQDKPGYYYEDIRSYCNRKNYTLTTPSISSVEGLRICHPKHNGVKFTSAYAKRVRA